VHTSHEEVSSVASVVEAADNEAAVTDDEDEGSRFLTCDLTSKLLQLDVSSCCSCFSRASLALAAVWAVRCSATSS
jgi:hypothetical protein